MSIDPPKSVLCFCRKYGLLESSGANGIDIERFSAFAFSPVLNGGNGEYDLYKSETTGMYACVDTAAHENFLRELSFLGHNRRPVNGGSKCYSHPMNVKKVCEKYSNTLSSPFASQFLASWNK